jgi:diguanylate cyclase (GGDEF)-like protein
MKDGQKRYFRPHVKEIKIENKILSIVIFDEITKELENIEVLKEKAEKDNLTGLFNRGKFDEVLAKEIALSQTLRTPLSIIFFDIDHFKRVNDTYGHDAGDVVLKELSALVVKNVRVGDFVARWGGEEFVVTLQSTSLVHAEVLAQKLRAEVEKFEFSEGGKQTISLGVTQYKQGESIESLMKRVDEALYEAKESGRNKVVTK